MRLSGHCKYGGLLLLSSATRATRAVTTNVTIKNIRSSKIVIAHRGASGYLPEHTLAGKALAFQMGADFLEQDVVMTKDRQLVVMHDIYLDAVTDVADVYPDRRAKDGQFYSWDFTLDEIRRLQVTERFQVCKNDETANKCPVYPNRFPIFKSYFRVHTLEEEIEFIQGLNKSLNKDVGIYPEIKNPARHMQKDLDITPAVLDVLKKYGYVTKASKCWLQCFDPNELKRAKQLMTEKGMDLRTVQLIAYTPEFETPVFSEDATTVTNYDYDWMLKPGGMSQVKAWADAIGPHKGMIVDEATGQIFKVVDEAHDNGLEVHPYTFRADVLPNDVSSFEEELRIYYDVVDVDGLFSDFPDRAVAVRDQVVQDRKAAPVSGQLRGVYTYKHTEKYFDYEDDD